MVLNYEIEHLLFQFMLGHPAVGDDSACVRDKLSDGIGEPVDALDAVMDEVYLTFAVQFAEDSFANAVFVIRAYFGDDAAAIQRRSSEGGNVTDT